MEANNQPVLQTLPGDDVRQIMWRYAERYDLAMLVQSTRPVARGPVARLVAAGARNSHEWTETKASLLPIFDESGITAAFLDPEHGGLVAGPKNLALALIAFELAWVDAGAATSSLAGNLGLAPIHERGTPEQVNHYMSLAAPAQPGDTRPQIRAAIALTEPIPFVGVETSMLNGRLTVAEWKEGQEPMLQVEKRGRFITGMGFANVVTAAVDSGDDRIQGTCMIILEEGDPGTFDRGIPSKKLVHQLSSTRDPVFSLRVPANRIIGGYTVKDGVIIPNYSHGEIIEAVFRRTRVTVGLMTSAKLLSAVAPVIMYQRRRFRGGEVAPGTPRFELGLQQKEDSVTRLADIWAAGEAGASLGFATARLFDELDPLERIKDKLFAEQKLSGRAQTKALSKHQQDALELLRLSAADPATRDAARFEALSSNSMVHFAILDTQANVLCPACKLWNTGHGATMMREAVSLMGGYGVTEDCPGFLGQKWADAQLEATYEGPEAVQRLQMSITMTNELFLAQFKQWIADLKTLSVRRPGTGACALGTAMKLWLWSLNHLQKTADPQGGKLYQKSRQSVTFPMADALCWLLSARQFILDTIELEEKGPANPALAEGLPGTVAFFTDLCQVQSARTAGEVGRICAELVFGYGTHPTWPENCDAACQTKTKAGPCVEVQGTLAEFAQLRAKLDSCLTGSRAAKDRAAESLTKVMIPEALDYPM